MAEREKGMKHNLANLSVKSMMILLSCNDGKLIMTSMCDLGHCIICRGRSLPEGNVDVFTSAEVSCGLLGVSLCD